MNGIWHCTRCDNIEAHEREVLCWECGRGEMVYVARERVADALRKPVARVLPIQRAKP